MGLQYKNSTGKGRGWGNYTVTVALQQYGADFKLLKEVDLTNKAGKISTSYSRLEQVGNKYYFIYLQAQEGNQLGDIKSIEINPATLELGEAKVIVSSTDMGFTLPDYRYTTYFDIICGTSPSAKFFMMLIKYRDNFFVCGMDENLVPRWKKKEVSKTITAPLIHAAETDDAGNIYIGYNVKLKAGYRRYSSAGASTDHAVNLPEGPANIILFKAKPDAVLVAGTYRRGDNCVGVYKGVVDKNGELISLNAKEFPKSLLETIDKDGWGSIKPKKYGIEPDFSAELTLSGDGNLVMLTEFSMEAGSPGREYMHTGGIIRVYFGEPDISFARAPKYSAGFGVIGYVEHSISSRGRFYYAYNTGSQTIIIYGDNPDNLDRSIEIAPKMLVPSKQILVAARIDKNGNMTREKIIPLSIPGHPAIEAETISFPVSIEGVDRLVILKK